MKLKLISFLVLLSIMASWAIGPNELPFGAMYLGDYADTTIQTVANDLCFNYMIEYTSILDADKINDLYDEGIIAIRGGMFPEFAHWDSSEYPAKYSWSNYGIVDAGDSDADVDAKMIAIGGSDTEINDTTWWVSDTTSGGDTLAGINTDLPDRYGSYASNLEYIQFFSRYHGNVLGNNIDPISYRIDFRMKIDSRYYDPDSLDLGDTVATVHYALSRYDAVDAEFYDLAIITADQFNANNQLETISIEEFTIPNNNGDSVKWYTDSGTVDTVLYDSTKYSLGVAIELRTTGEREVWVDEVVISDFDGRELIDSNSYDAACSTVFSQYDSISNKIYGWYLMDEPMWSNYMPFAHIGNLMQQFDSTWIPMTVLNEYYFTTDSYLDIVEVDFTMPDPYPYGGNDPYYGDSFQMPGFDNGAPLEVLNRHINKARPSDSEKGMWLTVQASELSCITFMGLAHGCRGIQFWYYNNSGFFWDAIIEYDGDRSPLFYEIKDCIGPYIQAFDEYYMPLEWIRSFEYNPAVDTTPSGSLINSIQAFSHPDSVNPDVGWFQVGEFHDDYNDYFMLVNRACSSDSTGNRAPSVTAIIELNSDESDLLVIDLANSTRLAVGDSGWVAVPETTYTCLYDSSLYFTTVLKAGEGRLFKIESADLIDLQDGVHSTFKYQGTFEFDSTSRVSSTGISSSTED